MTALSLTPTQLSATHPEHSVWLAAHAGTGKTRVLVERVLRLLLRGEDPSSIVAITYTTAAAAEMQQRLRQRASEFASMDESELRHALMQLGEAEIDNAMLVRARRLLLQLTESTPGLQIQTIHGFCQSLLSRFPIEAGLSGPPQVMDDRQRAQLLSQAKNAVFDGMGAGALKEENDALMRSLGDGSLSDVLDALTQESANLFALWATPSGRQRYRQALYDGLEHDEKMTPEEWLARAPMSAMQRQAAAEVFLPLGGNAAKVAAALGAWDGSAEGLEEYCNAYLTIKGAPTARLLNKAMRDADAALCEMLLQEQEWAADVVQWLRNEELLILSNVIATYGQRWLEAYESLKEDQSLLDYTDLIHLCYGLLSRPGVCEWVLSKLDFQLKHILLDEAQDTSPEQWRLIQLLVEELFVPELYHTSPRTLFIVGDQKQSIYRFQGADPAGFNWHSRYFAEWFTQSAQWWEELTLDQSFRSSPAVLQYVDTLCALPQMQEALSELNTQHIVHHEARFGAVSLWPLIKSEATEKLPPWEVVSPHYEDASANSQLAQQIANDIAAKLKAKHYGAEDVLVLVQRRSAFVGLLSRALQQLDVPVAGADRLNLSAHLAVQDVRVLAEWCLHQSDDLALATVLKGPLFRWSDEQVFECAHAREESLLQALEQSPHEETAATLSTIAARALNDSVYDWLCYVLDELGMSQALMAEIGEEVADVVTELKSQALAFESQSPASLQLFLQWFAMAEGSIKRDMEQGVKAVRIMTVHGAKGLEAPLVYLPDTTRIPPAAKGIHWHVQNDIKVGYVPPSGFEATAQLKAIKDRAKQADEQEYLRLLYVALTRAKYELVICGVEGARAPSDDCWYRLLERVFEKLEVTPGEQGEYVLSHGEEPHEAYAQSLEEDIEVPRWLDIEVPQPAALKTLSPSSLIPYAHEEEAMQGDGQGVLRGDLTHHLLQLLPRDGTALNAAQLRKALMRLAPDWPDADEIVHEVMDVYKEHGWIFGSSSRAEISLQGEVMWRGERMMLRGQIDRFLEKEERIVIVDYKSNRSVPEQMPDAYLLQLAAYRAMVMPLYPTKAIEAALLWTQNGQLQWADTAAMDTLCKPCAPNLDAPAA